MIERIFFDTDCLSAFLWVKNENLLVKLYCGKIVVPEQVGGIIASNNLRDIQKYVEAYKLEHITTGDILWEALGQGIITEEKGNIIWANMLDKRRMLPSSTFTEFILTYKKG